MVAAKNFDLRGEVVKIKEMLDDNRVIVTYRADEERVFDLAASMEGEALKFGDSVLVDFQSGLILERMPNVEEGCIIEI